MNTLAKYIPYVAIAILLLLYVDSCNKRQDTANAYSAAADSTRVYKNKYGQEVAQKDLIQTENKKAFLKMTAMSEEMAELQAEVKKLKGKNVSATILTTGTTNIISTTTDTIILTDTVREGNTLTVFPTYTYSRNNEWERFNIKASKDSLNMDYDIYNKFIISQSMVRKNGLFSKKVPTITVTNENPHTSTKQLQSYKVDCKCKKGQWFGIGAGVGFVGAAVLFNKF